MSTTTIPDLPPPVGPVGRAAADRDLSATATARLTMLKTLATEALDRWNDEDRQGALDAVRATAPVAAAAAAVLTTLLEPDRTPARTLPRGSRQPPSSPDLYWG